MRPLHAVAIAVVLIGLDFRTTSIDLLPDVVGWALIVWAALRLRTPLVATAASVGGVASLALLSLPYHFEQYDPFNDRMVVVTPETDLGYNEVLVYDDLVGWRLAAFAVSVCAFAVVLIGLWRHLRCAVAAWDGPSTRRSMRRLDLTTAAMIGVWVAPRLVAAALGVDGGYDPVWDDPAARVAMMGVVAFVAHAVALALDAREPWARRVERAQPASR